MGGTVLLFTDGLVEDRRCCSTTTWRSCAPPRPQAAGADVEAFANHVLALFGLREDDVAMIAVRRTG